MKPKEEMISLNSGKAEFDGKMGLEERLEKLTHSELQKIKGGSCAVYDSSSSEEQCACNRLTICTDRSCQANDWCLRDDGCNCNGDFPHPCGFNATTCPIDLCSEFCPGNRWICSTMST